MVYMFTDPGRDWETYCCDNKNPWDYYCEDDFIESDMISNCCGSDITAVTKNKKKCNCCGKYCAINVDESMKKMFKRLENNKLRN